MKMAQGCASKLVSQKLQANLFRVMSVSVVKAALLNGHPSQVTATGTLRSRSVGDMEMIDKHGVKAKFTDKGVEIEIVNWTDRCVSCNDPRLLREGNRKVCAFCGCRQ